MHSVFSAVRRILPSELPKVKNLDGTERAATAQLLLDMGIADLGDGYYSCREQENDFESRGTMRPLVKVRGTVVTAGPAEQRHERLPTAAKADLWRARVRRGADPNIIEVGIDEVLQADEVISAGVKKHKWSGESEM